MKNRLFIFILLGGVLSVIGCGDSKTYNSDLVGPDAAQAFRSDYQDVIAALKEARIHMVEESNDEGELIQFSPQPEDLSRIPEVRIAALQKLSHFAQDSVEKYSGKKHLKNKKFKYLVSEKTKSTFDACRKQSDLLIQHYEAVKVHRLNPDFMDHDDYLKIAGEVLEKIKKANQLLKESYGVELSPGLAEKDELLPQTPQFLFTEASFIESQNAALSTVERGLNDLQKALKNLEGRFVVVSLNHFVNYGIDHTERLPEFQEQLKALKALILSYKNDLKESVENSLLKEGFITRIDKSPDSKNPSIQDLTTYFRMDEKKIYAEQSDERYRRLASEFAHYQDTLLKFSQKYEEKTDEAGSLDFKYINAGEAKIIQSSLEEAKKWENYFMLASSQNKDERILTFGEVYDTDLKALAKKQTDLRNALKAVGALLPPGVPISSVERNSTKFPRFIFKRNFHLDIDEPDLLEQNPQPLVDLYGFLNTDLLNFVISMARERKIIHISPNEKFSYGETELKRTKEAIRLVKEALQTYGKKPESKPKK